MIYDLYIYIQIMLIIMSLYNIEACKTTNKMWGMGACFDFCLKYLLDIQQRMNSI